MGRAILLARGVATKGRVDKFVAVLLSSCSTNLAEDLNFSQACGTTSIALPFQSSIPALLLRMKLLNNKTWERTGYIIRQDNASFHNFGFFLLKNVSQ